MPAHTVDLDIVAQMLQSVGISQPPAGLKLEPCLGGANGRVYRVETGEFPVVLKVYFADSRDRLSSEFAFLQYAKSCGITCVAAPLMRSDTNHMALFTYLDGEPIIESQVDEATVLQAGEFFSALNRSPCRSMEPELPMAAEACFSLHQHVECIQMRIDRLSELVPKDKVDRDATDFVHERLVPAWMDARALIRVRADECGIDFVEELPLTQRYVSPSDFGFHNMRKALNGQVLFFDFEYAGWDDPAKLLCDFALQVALPLPTSYYHVFQQTALKRLPDSTTIARRAELLMPLYRVKWACILLNEFLRDGRRRRRFAVGDISDRRPVQLSKAIRMLG